MKAENLQKLCETHLIKNIIPKFIIVNSIEEINENELCKDKLYAVRSSCDVEDNSNNSFAGQFKTFLNTEVKDVKDRAKQVFESFGTHSGKVIIQEMIESDISGIVFTANPVGILNEIVIVAGKGLGDNVVEDKVETTTYYYNIDDKLYYTEGEKILSNDILKDIINYSIIIKTIMEYDVDIEYAIKDNKVYILQARPITTLDNTSKQIVLDNSNIVESYPGISKPLTQDFVKEIYYRIFQSLVLRLTSSKKLVDKMDIYLQGMTDIANSRVYYRITNWYNVLNILPFSNKIISIWQDMMGVTNKNVTCDFKVNSFIKFKVLVSFINLILTSPRKMNKLNKYFNNRIEDYRTMVNNSKTNKELLDTYEIILKELTSVWDITLVNDMYSFIFTALSGEKGKVQLANIKNLESMKPVKELNELVKLYKKHGINEYYKLKEKEYIQLYGDRCPEELKLETKTYRTNPELLREYVKNAEIIDIKDFKDNKKYSLFVKRAKVGIYNREISRMNRTRIFGIARDIMLRIGSNLCQIGFLQNKEDVFYLYYNELKIEQNYNKLVKERKHLHKGYKNIPNYSRLVFKDHIINKSIDISSVELVNKPTKLYGIASSVGKVSGEVIVIDTPDINIDTNNKIIVTKTTDPGWVFMIKNSIGIIAEKGSMLSHTAIITRELHKPSIVNVKDITSILKSGDIIELDAINGIVNILERKENER